MANHDQRFKNLLEAFLAEFLRLILGDEAARRYDCTKAEWLPQEVYPDPPQGQRLVIDAVVKVPVAAAVDAQQERQPEPWVVLIHAEIESEDSVAPLRVYDYRHELRRKYNLPVLSLGVYLNVALDGLGWDSYVETYAEQEILRFRYPYIGLPGLEAFDYVNGENILGAALAALMNIPPGREGELQALALDRIENSDLGELQRYYLAECVDAYLPLEGPQLADFHKRYTTPKTETTMKRTGKTLRDEGRDEGRQEGSRELILRTLERKFGSVPPAIAGQVRALPDDALLDLNVRLGTANSLGELGLADESTGTGA